MITYDIDYFFSSGGKDKKSILKDVYFEIVNYLKTIPLERFLDPNYGIKIYQFENDDIDEVKMQFLQLAIIGSLIQLNETFPPYKRFLVNPYTVRVSKEDNVLKIGILIILEQDFISNTTVGTGILDDDFLKIIETIRI
jgi:hypothetical protein